MSIVQCIKYNRPTPDMALDRQHTFCQYVCSLIYTCELFYDTINKIISTSTSIKLHINMQTAMRCI